MPQHEPSTLLSTVEIIHWLALAFMALVYTIRLFWLFSFRGTKDRQPPGNLKQSTPMKGAIYSLGNVAMPWAMESTRRGWLFYLSFVIFHLGVVAGISLAFLSSLDRSLLEIPAVSTVMMVMLGAAFAVGVGRIIRRIVTPYLRLISSPDDYFSVILLTVWFLVGVFAQAYIAGKLDNEMFLVVYLLNTSFFLVYVPFSKISHYLYYPFARFWIGRTLGHRGSFPYSRG